MRRFFFFYQRIVFHSKSHVNTPFTKCQLSLQNGFIKKKQTNEQRKTKQLKEGFGGLSVPDSEKRFGTSVVPMEEVGLNTKVLFMLQSKGTNVKS